MYAINIYACTQTSVTSCDLRRRKRGREMQRRERGGSYHYHLRPQMQLPSTLDTGTMLNGEDVNNVKRTSRKKRKTENPQDWRPWAELPQELVDVISKKLTIPDYFRFGRVCQNWWSISMASKQNFMSLQAPLVIHISTRAKRTCLFYDISNGAKYETKLPYFGLKFCIGLSCGYIIMEDLHSTISLVNPVTGSQYLFPKMASPGKSMSAGDRSIFASTVPNQDFILVVLSQMQKDVHFRRSKDKYWRIYSFAGKPKIWDILVFKASIYVITNDGRIGTLNLKSAPEVNFLELNFTPHFLGYVKLVASKEQLMVIDFVPSPQLRVYTIDFSRMEWVQVTNLGGHALFLGNMMCSRLSNPAQWGGRENCVYYLPFRSKTCYVYSISGQFLDRIHFVIEDKAASSRMNCWYFPHLSCSIDYVRDEIGSED
ncbi:hypothetical protein Patl1_02961 [Pistacia atlantica]|uniref:Uncharacterized protein n=1 Tax=Pistacia atlantica TaxID=434234 RepID=A0ACC1C8L7_9ROSI|nr:hypothetical protein Patl1_02961 [Pistacia atlantica]